jgi:hypothetical protein
VLWLASLLSKLSLSPFFRSLTYSQPFQQGKVHNKMSWQSYVDSNMVGTGACQHAAIIGLDGNTWATSAGFAVSPAEGKAMVAGFSNSQPLAAAGVKVNGSPVFFFSFLVDWSVPFVVLLVHLDGISNFVVSMLHQMIRSLV